MEERTPLPLRVIREDFCDPGSPEAIVSSSWDTIGLCPLDQIDDPPVIAQAFGQGYIFRVRLPIFLASTATLVYGSIDFADSVSAGVFQTREVAVVVGFGGPDASNRYMRAVASRVPLQDLLRISIASLQPLYDIAFNSRMSLETLLSHGSSIRRVNVDDLVRMRGGDPDFQLDRSGARGLRETNHRLVKSGGWALKRK